MSDPAAPDRQAGVLISGAFGTGKSSTAEETATLIEARGLADTAIDLDWLAWFDTGTDEKEEGERVMLDNLVTVVELRAPLPTIERRLRSSPTSGRLDDLRRARNQIEVVVGAPRVDATIDGDRPVGEVASDILRLLRW
jgi:hypothetical protein